MPVNIKRDDLHDKILGCWTGKSIGGTLGGPFEGRREILEIDGYVTPPGEPLPNDDLDLQLVWLLAVQQRGARAIDAQVLGEYWLNYIPPHWNEYGINKANQRLGLVPPLSGSYRNPWKHSNGAWIRSEIWACLAPGAPDVAARLAYEDAVVDHGGGEGTYAAMFTAAVEAAAFVVSDTDELIDIGLSKIPPDARVSRAIDVARKGHAQGLHWAQTREQVVADSEDLGWFQAPANVAFVVLGWLYGEGDFGRSLQIAIGCGDDTDCTGATLGSILGIIGGRKAIPPEWIEPIGERIVTKAIDIGSFRPPGSVRELTDQVVALVEPTLASFSVPVLISDEPTDLSEVASLGLASGRIARKIWQRSPYATRHDLIHTEVILDYGRDPDARTGEPIKVRVGFTSRFPDRRDLELTWMLPDGWEVRPSSVGRVVLDSYLTDIGAGEVLAGSIPDIWPPQAWCEVEIVPGPLSAAVHRGVLQIVAPGRPTVGLVPLVFVNGEQGSARTPTQ